MTTFLLVSLICVMIIGSVACTSKNPESENQSVPLHDFVDAISDIHGLALDPLAPSVLWVGSHQGLLRYSSEKGWEIVGEVGRDTMGPLIDQDDSAVMYATFHPSPLERFAGKPLVSGIMRSLNRGLTWESVSLEQEVDPHVFAVGPSHSLYLAGIYMDGEEKPGLLYLSDNGGQSWRHVETGLTKILALAVHPANPAVILAGAPDGLYLSEDGGKTFDVFGPYLSGIGVSALAYNPVDSEVIWAYAQDNEIGLVKTADMRRTWKSVGMQFASEDWIDHIAISAKDPTIIHVSLNRSRSIFRSNDGGETWNAIMVGGAAAP